MNPCPGAARQAALQVEHTRITAEALLAHCVAGLPFELQFPFGVVIGKPHSGYLDQHLALFQLPGHVRRQLRKRNKRLLKHARQRDRAVLQQDIGLAPGLGQVELQCGAAHTRCPDPRPRTFDLGRYRLHCQLLNPPFRFVLVDRARRTLPFDCQTLDQPPGRVARQGGMHLCAQRQPTGDLRQGCQVEPVRHQVPMGRTGAVAVGLGQLDIPARPAQALGRVKRQVPGRELDRPRRELASQLARHRRQLQGLQCRIESGRHIGEDQIGGDGADTGTPHIDPGPHRATPLLDIHTQIGIPLEL